MVLSAGVALLVVLEGIGLSLWAGVRLRFEERIAVGVVVGVLAFNVTTFLAFELMGMGWAAVGIGLAVPGIGAVAGARRGHRRVAREFAHARRRMRRRASDPSSLRPLAVFAGCALIVTTRILSLAYQRTDRGLSAGSLAVWSDWAAHLAYAGSFADGDNRGLDLPIASGTPFKYHFLVDFFGAVFTVSGATLQQSMVLSVWMLAAVLPVLLWCVVERLTSSRLSAALAVLLFILNGGIGLLYFWRDVEAKGWRILTSLPQTYARIPDQHLWVDNAISASLYAQRSTLLGMAGGSAALVLVLAARPGWRRGGFVLAGVILGVLGIAHAHMLLTGLALGGLAMLVDRRRVWLALLVPAAIIGLPLAWAISPATNSIRWMIGWMAPASGQPWIWFWLRNVGLFLPLFAGLALLGAGRARLRRLTMPLWLWFIVPNIVAFHPSEWNNTKYFLFWQLAGSILIADWLSTNWKRSRRADRPRVPVRLASISAVLLLISAGGLDTVRAMQRSTAIPWVEHDDLAAAAWLRENSTPDDVIVYGMTNYSAVAALGGRRSVSGYTGWTYDLGLPDWVERWNASRVILTGSDGVEEALDRYGVDFVSIGPAERIDPGASDEFWSQRGRLVFERGAFRIYTVG